MLSSDQFRLNLEYRPFLLSRRGEFFAWLCAFISIIAWGTFILLGDEANPLIKILSVVLIACGMAISLGNWMDRHTLLRINEAGIEYENGLRRIFMPWEQICEVQVFPNAWGNKVRVTGQRTYFAFRMLGEVTVRGVTKGRLGFAEGDKILAHILEKSSLNPVQQTGPGYYYVRD